MRKFLALLIGITVVLLVISVIFITSHYFMWMFKVLMGVNFLFFSYCIGNLILLAIDEHKRG